MLYMDRIYIYIIYEVIFKLAFVNKIRMCAYFENEKNRLEF